MQHDQYGDDADFQTSAQATTAAEDASADQSPATASGQSTREIIAALFASAEQNFFTLRDELPTAGDQLAFNNEVIAYLTDLTKSVKEQNSKINDEAKVEAALKELDELRAKGCTDRKMLAAALAKANPAPKRKPKDDSPKVFKKLLKEEYADNNGDPDYTQGHNGTLKGTPPAGKKYYKLASGKPDDDYYRDATPEEIAEMTKIQDDWLEANGRANESSRFNKA